MNEQYHSIFSTMYNKLMYSNKGHLVHCIISLCTGLEINCATDSIVHYGSTQVNVSFPYYNVKIFTLCKLARINRAVYL